MSKRYQAYDVAGWSGDRDWAKDDIYALMVTDEYIPDFKRDASPNDIPRAALVTSSEPLTGKKIVGSAVDADDLLFLKVTGPDVVAIVLVQDRGALSRLIAYIDDGEFPIVPNGGDINLKWAKGARRIMTD